ncbi:hypothetical protein ACLOJK_034030 [Asimina triloba]
MAGEGLLSGLFQIRKAKRPLADLAAIPVFPLPQDSSPILFPRFPTLNRKQAIVFLWIGFPPPPRCWHETWIGITRQDPPPLQTLGLRDFWMILVIGCFLFFVFRGVKGDRFIPNRSLMNIDIAQSLLRTKNQDAVDGFDDSSPTILTPREEYRRRLEERLLRDSEGKPFKMLVFKGSPRTSKVPLVDEMLQEEKDKAKNVRTIRHIPNSADRILDAPGLLDDFYLNLMDWGQNNMLAIALGTCVYLWNAETCTCQLLTETYGSEVYPASLAWSTNGKTLAVGMSNAQILLWDATTFGQAFDAIIFVTPEQVRSLGGHSARVGSLAWNGNLLTSGSKDGHIINHDVREDKRFESCKWEHTDEQAVAMTTSFVYGKPHIRQHPSACFSLKNIAQLSRPLLGVLISPAHWPLVVAQPIDALGYGTLRQENAPIICALEWNRHQKEILSAHGYNQNQLCLWRYPSMSKMGELRGHKSRILSLSQSPDGLTVASASADETIGMWKVFGPPSSASLKVKDESDSPLSIKRLHIR